MNTKLNVRVLFTIGLMTLKNKEYFLRKLQDRWVYNSILRQSPFWDMIFWYVKIGGAFLSNLILSFCVMLGFLTLVVRSSPATIYHGLMNLDFWSDHTGKVLVSLLLFLVNFVCLGELEWRSLNNWWSAEPFFKGVLVISETLFSEFDNLKVRLEKFNTCGSEEIYDLIRRRLIDLALYVVREEKGVQDVKLPAGIASVLHAKRLIEEVHKSVWELDIPRIAYIDKFCARSFPLSTKDWYTHASKQVEKELGE